MWASFSIRNDVCHPASKVLFQQYVKRFGYPEIITFWTKQPAAVAKLYEAEIKDMQQAGIIVLGMVTLNGYGKEMEPGVIETDPKDFVNLPGADHVRFRLDPVIPGYTSPRHIRQLLRHCEETGVHDIHISMIKYHRKNVGKLFKRLFPQCEQDADQKRQAQVINAIVSLSNDDIVWRACAESANLVGLAKRLEPAGCHDIEWVRKFNPQLADFLTKQGNRPGCGCARTFDIGAYHHQVGGWRCPGQCLYCYAK